MLGARTFLLKSLTMHNSSKPPQNKGLQKLQTDSLPVWGKNPFSGGRTSTSAGTRAGTALVRGPSPTGTHRDPHTRPGYQTPIATAPRASAATTASSHPRHPQKPETRDSYLRRWPGARRGQSRGQHLLTGQDQAQRGRDTRPH